MGRGRRRELGIGTWGVCERVGIERRGSVSASVSVSLCVAVSIVESTVRMCVCVCVCVRVWTMSLRMSLTLSLTVSVVAVACLSPRNLNLQRLTPPPRPPNRKTKPLRVRFAEDAGSERTDEVRDREGEGRLGFTAVFWG